MRKSIGKLGLVALLGGLGIWLLGVVGKLSANKAFTVDEFQYAHGAWLISQGQVIYRDFFEHHFPLIHQVLAVPFLFTDSHPGSIMALRVAMLPFLFLLVFAAALINRRWDPLTGWVTPIVLLGTGSLVGMGVEIRPDVAVFGIFLAGVATLSSRLRPATKGALAGALMALAAWGTLKVVYYGLAVAAAFVADLVARRTASTGDEDDTDDDGFLGDPRAFVLGGLAVVAGIAIYLTVTSSWSAFFEWCIAWSFVHQRNYPPRVWIGNFLPLLAHHSWLFIAGGYGIARTLARIRARSGDTCQDVLLLGLLATTMASFAWQTSAYVYSFIPFLAMLGIFAARGLVEAYQGLRRAFQTRPLPAGFAIALLSLLLLGEVMHTRTLFHQALGATNDAQLETLARLDRIVAPGESVFDISGMRVTRPGVHYYYFMDAVIRDLKADQIATEIPAGILATGCSVYLHDSRFGSFPAELRQFLVDNFQPLDDTIWLWGRRFETTDSGDFDAEFIAVRSGRYFVSPPTIVQSGVLQVDGVPIEQPGFLLEAGPHAVTLSGPAARFAILWEPPTGPYVPRQHPIPPRVSE